MKKIKNCIISIVTMKKSETADEYLGWSLMIGTVVALFLIYIF